jgi:AcrR family transcriptional regulator
LTTVGASPIVVAVPMVRDDMEQGSSTRERVLDAAQRLAGQVGMAKLRVGQVAAEAGVSRQTIYNTFGDKLSLAQAVAVRVAAQLLDEVEADFARRERPGDAAAAAMAHLLTAARDRPLLSLTLSREKDDDMISLLTTEAAPVIRYARSRLVEVIGRRWPQIPRNRTELVADLAARLTISHLVCPTEPVEESARKLAAIVDAVLTAPTVAR